MSDVILITHFADTTMEKTLKRLGSFEVVPTPGPSAFVKPASIMYELDGTFPGSVTLYQAAGSSNGWRL